MARKRTPRIFCIEAYGQKLTDTESVKPLLDFFEAMGNGKQFYERVHTVEEFYRVSKMWCQKQYSDLSIGYFGFHGQPGCLRIGRKSIGLDELGHELQGLCKGRTIHFGSCSTLKSSPSEIEDFRRVTKIKCVTGYSELVDWFESVAFEILLFETLTRYQRPHAADRFIRSNYRPFVKKLGFQMHY